jgi:hypothetical protein
MSVKFIKANKNPWQNSIEILIGEQRGDRFFTADNLTLSEKNPDSIIEPSLRIDGIQAQALIDDLWRCGFRPTESAGSAASLSATVKHLEDMRRLVFEGAPK